CAKAHPRFSVALRRAHPSGWERRGRTSRWPAGYNCTMRRSLVLLALLVGPATRLPAQASADRAAIEALRDSLARVTDSLSLKRLETATIQVAKQNRD